MEDGAAADYSAAAEEGDLFVQKPPASAEQVGSAPLAQVARAQMGIIHKPVMRCCVCNIITWGANADLVSLIGNAGRQAAPASSS